MQLGCMNVLAYMRVYVVPCVCVIDQVELTVWLQLHMYTCLFVDCKYLFVCCFVFVFCLFTTVIIIIGATRRHVMLA